MQITGSNNYSYAASTGTGKSSSGGANSDSAFAELLGANDPAAILKEITKDGMQSMWSWQVKQIKAKIAEEIMGQKNLTKEMIAAMPAEQRAKIEDEIMREVEARVRQLIEEDMKKRQNAGIDLSTTPAAGEVGALLNITI